MPNNPLLDRSLLQEKYNNYIPPISTPIPNIPANLPLQTTIGDGGNEEISPLASSALENKLLSITNKNSGKLVGGAIDRSLAEVSSDRYDKFVPGDYDNEDAYAQAQGFLSKMVNGIGKGLSLTGTTFLQTTLGSVNGVFKAVSDGRAASFFDNEFNRELDKFNKNLENQLPNYRTEVERKANWYSPDYLLTGNFLWDDVVKNMGFTLGAAGAARVFSMGMKGLASLPYASRLFSIGKAAELTAATEEALAASNKGAEMYGKVKSLSDKFLGQYNTLSRGQRAVVAGLSTTGEAGFEAYNNLNEFRDKLVQEYKDTHNGWGPSGVDLEDINSKADSVGKSSFLLNTALLTATNYIQFEKILGSSASLEKGIIDKEINTIARDAAGKYVEKEISNSLLKNLNKVRPYTFSASEAFEEGSQYAIQIGTQDYYNKKYHNHSSEWLDSLSEGVKETLGTNEGMKNVLIGGLSGSLMQARGRFKENVKKEEDTLEALKKFNEWKISDFTKATKDAVNRGVELQKEREQALAQGDILTSKDLEQDYIINYLTPRIKYGRYDLVLSDIEDHKKLAASDEGFSQLQAEGKALSTDSRQAYLKRIQNLESTANNIKSLYESLQLRYSNIIDKQGKPIYNDEIMDKLIYSATKVADYDRRIPELSSKLLIKGIDASTILNEISEKGLVSKGLLNDLHKEINQKSPIDSDILIKDLNDLVTISQRRRNYIKEYNDLKKRPVKTETEEGKVSHEFENKLKAKELPLIGREYQGEPKVGKVEKIDEDTWGVDGIAYPTEAQAEKALEELNDKLAEQSKVKIVSLNHNGTIKVKDVSGLEYDIYPSELQGFERLQTEEEKEIQKQNLNKDNLKELASLHTKEEPVDSTNPIFEVEKKKPTNLIAHSTIGEGFTPTEDQLRANRFGTRFHTLPNRASLKGVILTQKTEDAIIPGLTQRLKGDSDVDQSKIIAMVIGEVDKDGKFTPVDENGNILEGDLLNKAIYQVFPLEDLEMQYINEEGKKVTLSMFRETASGEDKEKVRDYYTRRRAYILSDKYVPTPQPINASFGVIQYEKYLDDKGKEHINLQARNTVKQAGFVENKDFTKKQLISVGTNDTITLSGVTFHNAKNRLFLNASFGGPVGINNDRLGSKRAKIVYDAIHKLSQLSLQKDGLKSTEAKKLYQWLNSVVYWGVPKKGNAGYNSVWFAAINDEQGNIVNRLYISDKGLSYSFTPTALEQNKEAIVKELETFYHNVHINFVNSKNWNTPYYEYIDINQEPVKHDNYQSYLLSGTNPPLYTIAKQVKDESDSNRRGIYFYTTSTPEDVSESKPVAREAKVIVEKKTETKEEAPEEGIKLITPQGEFVYKIEDDKISIVSSPEALLNKLVEKVGEEQAKQHLVNYVNTQITKAAEVKVEVKTEEGTKPVDEDKLKSYEGDVNATPKGANDEVFRLETVKSINDFEKEDWNEVERFIKKTLPNFPLYRVKNIIKATNGRQAWGMLHNGAIYLYQNAEVGTVYHEVFEAVWKTFTDYKEQQRVIHEFKARKGSFTNRFTGKLTQYSEASYSDIKEELAEEFRDYIIGQNKRDEKSFISKLLSDIWEFFKSFFIEDESQINTDELFKRIGRGYYKDFIPAESQLSYAKVGITDIEEAKADGNSEFRIAHIPATQIHQIMQHMTYKILSELTKTNKSLFKIEPQYKSKLYPEIKQDVINKINWKARLVLESYQLGDISKEDKNLKLSQFLQLTEQIAEQWDQLVKIHEEEYLNKYGITFDENDDLDYGNEEKEGKGDYQDARTIDNFKKANAAIKLLTATIPVTMEVEGGNRDFKRNEIGLFDLLPFDKTFITIMNNLHKSTNINDMMEKLRVFSEKNPDYQALYKRLTKESPLEPTEFNSIKDEHQIQLLSAFWKTFKKQNADVKIIYLNVNGDVVIQDAHTADAVRTVREDLRNQVISTLRGKNKYITFNSKGYNATKVLKDLKLNPKELDTYKSFLKNIGVEMPKTITSKDLFITAVNGIKDSLSSIEEVYDLNKRTLNLDGRLSQLATLISLATNPDFESTYFSVMGERHQTYIGTSLPSDLYDEIQKSKNIKDLEDTKFSYLLSDNFAENSVILSRIYDKEKGDKLPDVENLKDILKTGIVDGFNNENNGRRKEPRKFSERDRLVEELNLNYQGWYLNLVPGDASIESMLQLHTPSQPFISENDLLNTWQGVYDIFRGYLISEINVSRENRPVAANRNTEQLRFMRAILGEELSSKIETSKEVPEAIYQKFSSQVDNAVKKFIIEKANRTKQDLKKFGIIEYTDEGLIINELAFAENKEIADDLLDLNLQVASVNYIIANIELHKLIYSDPYFYSDELKRIKNFNSPAQPLLHSSSKFNEALDRSYNKGVKKGELGYFDFSRDYFRTSVISDVFSSNDILGYNPFEETDGGGYISYPAYRNYRLRAGDWTDNDEKQYQYDIEFQKKVENNEDLTEYRKKNPQIQSAYVDLKPITRGNKDDGNSYNDIILDKFALIPLSFRILYELNPESNALKQYKKMIREDIDYTVFSTGRKVFNGKSTPLYNKDGSYNTLPFQEVNNIPFSIIAVQTEVPSKDSNDVTQGSQMTKLATMDYMEAGVPIDYKGKREEWELLDEKQKEKASELYKEIKNNQTLLQESIKEGYGQLLQKLGIKEENRKFVIESREKLSKTLKKEIFKREINNNIVDAFAGFEKGDVILEATPAYHQIRNILYSIANKQVVRRKISGGLKVQIPSTLLEDKRIQAKTVKNKKGEETNVFESNILEFYKDEDGKRVCEIMVGRWFDSSLSDQELLNYLNNTEEGKKILSGVAYRIPTQKQNSIDAFIIKKFLPKEFGDSVVVPSALVKKVGSDFDIDKLSIYFKNIFKDSKDNIKIVPFFGYGEEAKKKIADLYDEGNFWTDEQRKKLQKWINREIDEYNENAEGRLIKSIFGEQMIENEVIQDFLEYNPNTSLKEKTINLIYKQSLENAYIESLENLISHPLNFKHLVKPNSADELKDLADEITKLRGKEKFDYTKIGNLLDRRFMATLREAFLSGKDAIGIAATSQTNNAQNQRTFIYIDEDKLNKIDENDRKWLIDGKVKFEKVNRIDGKVTLSVPTNADNKYISDIIGMFIDGYVDISKGPWIMELGAYPNVASTWLFLTKIGVPIDTVAYFMNQPIIREYLDDLNNAGYKWLFNSTAIKNTLSEYKVKEGSVIDKIPSNSVLKEMISTLKSEMSDEQIAYQHFILNEFLKYAKMAEHLFHVQQATNYDTATINDPFLDFKKRLQLEKARKTIISSPDKILESSFVGELSNVISDIRDAYSTILLSDRSNVRVVLEKVLKPYTSLNDRDFVKVARKAVNDLFDWAVQNNTSLNNRVANILLGTDNVQATAKEVMEYIASIKDDEKNPLNNNYVLNSFKERALGKENTPQNLTISGKHNKSYDQNLIIYGFNELKEHLPEGLYGKIVRLAVLQSGLSPSPISFTSLLPYEDFKAVYNETISELENYPDLNKFYELNVFERNNWNDDDIVSFEKQKMVKGYSLNTSFVNNKLKTAMSKGEIPKTIHISTFGQHSDFIVFQWFTKNLSKKEAAAKRRKGDTSHVKKGLFRRVKLSDGTPYINISHSKGKTYQNFVYTQVNAWGDSYRANEFYDSPRPSVIDNGFEKVEKGKITTVEKVGAYEMKRETITSPEVNDEKILSYLEIPKKSLPLQSKSVKNQTPTMDERIKSISALRTFDFGSQEGTPQTKVVNEFIHKQIISHPDKPMVGNDSESFNQAVNRTLPTLFSIVDNAPANSIVITHNSIYGLIKVWDKNGRPNKFSKEMREEYIGQDNTAPPGSYFAIEGENGPITIVRHGLTSDNEKGVFRTKDTDLTKEGIEDAKKVGEKLADIPISRVYSSPLKRTLHTSNIILGGQKNKPSYNQIEDESNSDTPKC